MFQPEFGREGGCDRFLTFGFFFFFFFFLVFFLVEILLIWWMRKGMDLGGGWVPRAINSKSGSKKEGIPLDGEKQFV